ncbi:fumarase class II [Shewanella chilikensis]|uniref:Fumarate hydratase class II n=1 Tax=Shewanella chilikensis TaxID=558541 RepID=A0ABX5PKI1_9GAMM|nr:class II fumarate hydratase [Shewanella chilikensis]MCL1155291.1 class II fumarate hydratase [Shewanella chilikensis]PYE56917.1 fumarase class II [Shewanella chilikensis]GGZ37980.1 fumarate hydratase class II [Shewanella chilikensis]
MQYRIEQDTLGEVKVEADKYWGAQTQRSLENFPIGPQASMPKAIIHAFALLKKAAAQTNAELGQLPKDKAALIARVCDEILAGQLEQHFPLVIWQTGSGTQTNMNLNEVIANRGMALANKAINLSPNDDVNRSQSSNDTFPSAMHIAVVLKTCRHTLPAIAALRDSLKHKSQQFADIPKTGRTHFMDATPLTLGQEISAWVTQLDKGIGAIERALANCRELALGGTAVGTGLNAPAGYAERAAELISSFSGEQFVSAANKFEALSASDAMVELSGAFKRLAVSLMKIGNDIRMLASGPRCGIGELQLPGNEPGSSIMPGKVNPTQCEALTMVAAQVMGNDLAVSIGASNGQFQLNVFRPLIAANLLQSAELLGDACLSFDERCASGLEPNRQMIAKQLQRSLMLVTSLNPHIGYAKAAQIAKDAHQRGISLRQAALESGLVTEAEFDTWVNPANMLGPFEVKL